MHDMYGRIYIYNKINEIIIWLAFDSSQGCKYALNRHCAHLD